MYRTQVSPHRHGFLVERQYDSNDKGAWITIERYFTRLLDQPRKEGKLWMSKLYLYLNQPSAELPPIEIPIAPPISYNVHERLERAEAEIEARNAKDAADKAFIQSCLKEAASLDREETVFEGLERIVTDVSDRQPQ